MDAQCRRRGAYTVLLRRSLIPPVKGDAAKEIQSVLSLTIIPDAAGYHPGGDHGFN